MKINSPSLIFLILAVISLTTLPVVLPAAGDQNPVSDSRSDFSDGVPFIPAREGTSLLSALDRLQKEQDSLTLQSMGDVGFISLNRHNKALRGKIIDLSGRLLKTDSLSLPLPNDQSLTLYESWVLLDDERHIPVRLLTRSVPDPPDGNGDPGFTSNNDKPRIYATGVFYRTTACFDGDDFYNTPTILALEYQFQKPAKKTNGHLPSPNTPSRIPSRPDQAPQVVPRPDPENDLGPDGWRDLLLARFHESGPWSVLPDPDLPTWPDRDAQVLDRFEIHGSLTDCHFLSSESPSSPVPCYWQTTLATDGNASRPAILYSLSIPHFEINQTGKTGKSSQIPQSSTSVPVGESVGGTAVFLGWNDDQKSIPLFALPSLGWFPADTVIGRLGMNVASLDAVPVYSPEVISRASDSDSPDRKQILASLRMTAADRVPFYELLRVVRDAPPGLLRRNAVENLPSTTESGFYPVVELFNRPELHQGEPVLLRGVVRRTSYVPVSDSSVRNRLGIDHYYQLYLYTSDSQACPLVVSVPELPEGMEPNSQDSYRQEVEVPALFYKTWAYRIEEPDAGTSETDPTSNMNSSHWIRAPLLIGGDVTLIPQEEETGPPIPLSLFFSVFIFLALSYLGYRQLRRRWR